jgi:hypothetical protein
MAGQPSFPATPRTAAATLSAANTNRDGTTGTYVSLFTAASTGSLVWRILVTATSTTTAGVIRLFLSTDGGTTRNLVEELLVGAVTPSTTVPVYMNRFRSASLSQPIILGASTNNILYVTTNNAEGFRVLAEGGDL